MKTQNSNVAGMIAFILITIIMSVISFVMACVFIGIVVIVAILAGNKNDTNFKKEKFRNGVRDVPVMQRNNHDDNNST